MPIRQIQLQCTKCDAVMPHNQPTPNHVVHALVSLFLVGLWIPIWILIAVSSGNDPATCVKCGGRQTPKGVILAPSQATAPIKPVNNIAFTVILVVAVAGGALFAWGAYAGWF